MIMMPNKNLLLIVNPHSGKGKMRGELLSVVEIFSAGGYSVTVYPTRKQGDATKYVAALPRDIFDIIVVSGGDGTLNEVITGLMQGGRNIPLGYIPAGTLNEWSSGLGISRDIKTAAKDLLKGREIVLDIGKFNNRYFSYTASFGAFTEASYTTPQDVKNVLGQAAYFFEGIKCLGNIKPIHLSLKSDTKNVEGDFLFGAVSNSMSVGGIVKFDETLVKLNDGKFEVLLIRNPAKLLQYQNLVDGILRQDLNREGIEFFHANDITIESEDPISWTLDGEYAPGLSPLHISNLHHAVRLIVPDNCTTE